MSIITIYSASALGPGSELWILPHYTVSHWSRKLDWYLNFQIQRFFAKAPKSYDSKLKNILIENSIAPFEYSSSKQQALLIASEQNLPNRYTLVLPPNANNKDWVDLACKKWLSIGQPSLRVFLPPAMDENAFRNFWIKETSEAFDISLVTNSLSRPSRRTFTETVG